MHTTHLKMKSCETLCQIVNSYVKTIRTWTNISYLRFTNGHIFVFIFNMMILFKNVHHILNFLNSYRLLWESDQRPPLAMDSNFIVKEKGNLYKGGILALQKAYTPEWRVKILNFRNLIFFIWSVCPCLLCACKVLESKVIFISGEKQNKTLRSKNIFWNTNFFRMCHKIYVLSIACFEKRSDSFIKARSIFQALIKLSHTYDTLIISLFLN
jgi:hypothetical protein